jgi:hypothetical protein
METRTFNGKRFTCFCAFAIILMLAACRTTPKVEDPIRTKSATELGVAEIKLEWLIPCKGLETPQPENEIGALLQDYADLAKVAAECALRHNSLLEYLGPIVKKERGGK